MTAGRIVANIKYGEFKLRQYIAERAGLLFSDHSATILEGAQAAWRQYEREPQSIAGGALGDILSGLSLDLEALRAEAIDWSPADRANRQREFAIVTL